jgi:hypothetical protein
LFKLLLEQVLGRLSGCCAIHSLSRAMLMPALGRSRKQNCIPDWSGGAGLAKGGWLNWVELG